MMLENQECCGLNLCGSKPNMGLRISDKVQLGYYFFACCLFSSAYSLLLILSVLQAACTLLSYEVCVDSQHVGPNLIV